MIPVFPIGEFFDRLAISQVKWEKIQNNKEELDWYTNQVDEKLLDSINDQFENLKDIHRKIWELEFALKMGKEQELPLEEIGRRAIAIRDWNNKRTTLKNQINELLDCAVREIKKDHLSE
jgi:predicted transcriptional regulator